MFLKKVDIDHKNKENESCLTVALQFENYLNVEKFLENGIRISSKDCKIAEGVSLVNDLLE